MEKTVIRLWMGCQHSPPGEFLMCSECYHTSRNAAFELGARSERFGDIHNPTIPTPTPTKTSTDHLCVEAGPTGLGGRCIKAPRTGSEG